MSKQLSIFSNNYQTKIYPSNSSKVKGERIPLKNSEITLYRKFFTDDQSKNLFLELQEKIAWKQETIKLYGKTMPIPRLTAWYGDSDKTYVYSGITLQPLNWIKPLILIKNKIECFSPVKFNSVLLNLYRNGNDSVAWHSDDEPELGKKPIIGSVSLGGSRRFMFKSKDKNNPESYAIELTNGSFLLMAGDTQKYWLHQIPKTKKAVTPRINLTFRVIYS
ncbi:alpha-ketoglutarate-dependent dioxygenase AlkB family protein [Geminocystis herdmanii]|uniref:alpha-ketoglutarate-dependent dioxygenase AlkB family protein n=1 Tax=Geminocystis herdmanii TaxID=669359 RepID=UPI000344E679|nr:alpha-ketoglutarate-dependent dioxygenase AlkB [Geminocystis herdmanii]